jgi:excisionase family DNA binding protein
MPRLRTVKQVVEHFRESDPGTAITEWWLRQLLKEGKIRHHKSGNKFLVDLDHVEEFINNPEGN